MHVKHSSGLQRSCKQIETLISRGLVSGGEECMIYSGEEKISNDAIFLWKPNVQTPRWVVWNPKCDRVVTGREFNSRLQEVASVTSFGGHEFYKPFLARWSMSSSFIASRCLGATFIFGSIMSALVYMQAPGFFLSLSATHSWWYIIPGQASVTCDNYFWH